MSSESQHHVTHNEKGKRRILLSARTSWTCLDEDFPTPEVDNPLSTPYLVDPKEQNMCNWLDSGFYLSASKDLQERRDKAALSPPTGMVQMSVKNYMRSLHRFSEMPVLSQWSSANSVQSHHSAPKSVTEWLEFWEKDPVEILLDLGFGADEPDICTKIPSRFISSASMAEGINIRVFLEAQRQRMDVENPNLYGRFRQLEVLDHVTSAFSSLLNDINTMHPKSKEVNREEKCAMGTVKGKLVITQAKRRRISQLLRKASRQTSLHGPPIYRNTGTSRAKEDHSSPIDEAQRIASRTGLPENTALVALKEELHHCEEEDDTGEEAVTVPQPPQPTVNKTRVLPHLPIKQPNLPSTFEMPLKDRLRKEPNLLLTHMLRRVSGLNCKPSESFEMEEIQSFEDESSCGNPLESTSDVIVTRTNSCQSDSSGFLEDPSEPLPLQVSSLPGNLRLSCNTQDSNTFLQHRKDPALTRHDFYPHAEGLFGNTSITDDITALLFPSLSREHTFQGEEIFYSITEEDNLHEAFSSSQSERLVSEQVKEVAEKEVQGGGGPLEQEDSFTHACASSQPIDNIDQLGSSPPQRNCLSHLNEMYESVGSTPTEISCTDFMVLSSRQICEDRKESEEAWREKQSGDDCKGNVPEGIAEGVAEKWYETKACGKVDSLITVKSHCDPSDCQDSQLNVDLNSTGRHVDRTMLSKIEHELLLAQHEINGLSRRSLQESSCLGQKSGSFNISAAASTGRDQNEGDPATEMSSNPLKSVTVQMPSRLMSSLQSISLGEAKCLSMDFPPQVTRCSEVKPVSTSVPDASKEDDKQMREVSSQTDKSQIKRETHPHFHVLPSVHGHGHLVKSASLDTGLYGKCRSHGHEPFHDWGAQYRGLLTCHYHRPLWPPLTSSCQHPVICCPSYTTVELQLLKTLKLLQDTAIRNISSCTVQEIEAMKNSCQTFRKRLDEIEQHLVEQEALFPNTLSEEGREERRQLQFLRQAVRREVAELECQLKDLTRQVREGILLQLDQLLGEQSSLRSELGIPDWREEREAQKPCTRPNAATFFPRAGCSKDICPRFPKRSATVPSSPSVSLQRKTELLQSSALATGHVKSTADPKEHHTSKKETKGPSQTKLDFKSFIQNLKKSFRNSFSNDAAEGRD